MTWLAEMPFWAQTVLGYGLAHAATDVYRLIKLLATKDGR